MLKIGYFQFRPIFGQPRKNLKTVIRALADVSADVIVLPELAFSGYLFKDRAELEALAEDPRNSDTVNSLINLCRDKNFHIVSGFAERSKDKIFNSALLTGPAGLLQVYRKLHLFNNEKEYFDPGDTPLKPIRVNDVKLGMMVCFDWIFPEVMRSLALQGADIICHPSNLVLDHCQNTMISRSIENGVFIVTANRTGIDSRPHGQLRFTGKSQIVAPMGKMIRRGPAQRNELFITEIDPSDARNKNITERNHIFLDRRPRYYGELHK